MAVLSAEDVTVTLPGKQLLGATSLDLEVGKLVGLIGPSGAGKSTLLRVLAGVTEPSDGEVTINGNPVALHTDEVGFVPYGDLLHDRLSVREALAYVAALRLDESDPAVIHERVEEVLGELRISNRGDARVGSLSGGERRRAAVGAELIGRPSVLILDEPATGLDPGLERRLMVTMRRLADEGRAVLLATHATASLGLCDQVAVMAPEGKLRFLGPPDELLSHFGVNGFEEIYDHLDLSPPEEATEDAASGPVAPVPQRDKRKGPRGPAPLMPQARVLAGRYSTTLLRDRRTLMVLLGQAPFLGFGIGVVMPATVIEDSTRGPFFTLLIAFMLMLSSVWLGFISSCREIVKERAIVAREFSAGVRLDAYILAKCMVLFPLAAAQSVLLALVVVVIQPLESYSVLPGLLLLCILSSWSAVALGLWLSSKSRSSDQATSAVPLMLVPQILLAGALIPVAQMLAPIQALSLLSVARWSFTGIGNQMGLGDRIAGDTAAVTGFSEDFFLRPNAMSCAIVLIAFTLVTLAAAGLSLDKQLGRRSQVPE